jgi:hypothetical protein
VKQRTFGVFVAALLAVGALAAISPGLAAAATPKQQVFDGRAYLRLHGYLPLRGVQTLQRAKAHAAAVMAARNGRVQTGPTSIDAPTIGASWQGVNNTGLTPPDPNGAIGPTRYVEIVNVNMQISDRTGVVKGTGLLSTITGHGSQSDPMVLWDPNTQRFYFNVWDTANATMDWGFSKTDTPNAVTTADWCSYETNFGYAASNAPDYPKLGQTKDFLFIGVNFYPSFSSDHATSGDVLWTQKPQGSGPINQCPAASSFNHGKVTGLKNGDGTQAFTPVPAIQTDASSKGYIVASSDIECPPTCGTGTKITVFTVKPSAADPTKAKVPTKGKSVTVGSFMSPPDAPQKGTADTLDTLDGRVEHAVSGVDPTVGKTVVWTGHAVAGGAGSEYRWYELLPGKTTTVVQSGTVNNNNLWVFNGSVSPDRVVKANGSKGHGDNMVVDFNTSSATQFSAIQVISKKGAGAQSAFVLVKQATLAETDFSCTPTCRWGDYAGATPDPGASTGGATGEVWISNNYAGGSHLLTWNAEIIP